MKTENKNIIHLENLGDEDKKLVLSGKKVYAKEGSICPMCNLDTIREDTMGFLRVSTCSRCDYYAEKTI